MEKAVRWSMVGLMVALIIGLSFSLGFVLRMTLEDDGSPAATASAATTKDGDPDFGVLSEIYGALRDNYIEPERIDPELLRTGAINGLINAVGDTHQVYITRESRQAESRSLNGKYEGIGASVDLKGGEVIISRPFDGSPAKQAGIRIGDAILEVDGKSTKGWTTQQAVQNILGPRGSQVKLKVRHTDGKIEEITITRDEILLPSVHVDVPSNADGVPQTDLGYIRIDQFTGRTGEEMKQALRDAKDKGFKGMILDLRNNPGGLVSSCVSVASQFLKSSDVVFIEQLRNGEEKNFKASSGGLALDIPMTVLVNHNSASCSEIIAGSLRDNRRAVVIGETTLGKGTVNQFFDLKRDGGALYVTIGRWLTPKRDQIEGRGVTPDISAAAADNEDPLGYFNAVMYRAVDFLRNGG